LDIIEQKIIYKLDSLGLIRIQDNKIIPSCQLYVDYFQKEFGNFADKLTTTNLNLIKDTSEDNEQISYLYQLDELTQLANRRIFDRHMGNYWQNLIIEQKPLAIIMCDIDFFTIYNDTYGQEKGNECLQQIANILKQCIRRSSDLVARYDEDKLAIILPYADVYFAFQIAAKIRDKVRELKIPQTPEIFSISPILTVSLGLASLIPSPESSCDQLLQAVDLALSESKHNGKDQVTISSLFNYGLINN
jgi:diguanylate cyclase (GGDEF)-like protein